MQLTDDEFNKLVAACRGLPTGPDYRVDDYVLNLLITVLDFQMESTVVSASIDYFRNNHSIRSHRKLTSELALFPDTKSGNVKMAQYFWGNNHWTRAKFLRKILKEFDARGIRGQASLKKWFTAANFESDVKGQFRTKEHSIGIALFHWLQLRLGVDTVKPDVHILNYVQSVVGRKVTRLEAVDSLTAVAKKLRRKARVGRNSAAYSAFRVTQQPPLHSRHAALRSC